MNGFFNCYGDVIRIRDFACECVCACVSLCLHVYRTALKFDGAKRGDLISVEILEG